MKYDDVSAFLPPGFELPAEGEEETAAAAAPTTTTTPKPTTTTAKSTEFKLDLANLFGSVEVEDVSSFLPPGFNAAEEADGTAAAAPASEAPAPPPVKTTEKITLKFPTRPGSDGSKKLENSKKFGSKVQGPPPFVPKIKSFSDRYVNIIIIGRSDLSI